MIGVFDSGLGGLIVLKEILKINPNLSTIYLGDVAHLPYGNKSAKIINTLTLRNVEMLIKKKAKIIVIACNSASASAIPQLRKKFPKTIFFNVITPAVARAIKTTKNYKIGVIGTKATISSSIYQKLIHKKNPKIKIYSQTTPLLVPLIENCWEKKKETYQILQKYLNPLIKKKIDTLILGCTHYPILLNQIKKIMGPKIKLINSAKEVAIELNKYLKNHPNNSKNLNQYLITDFSPGIEKISQNFFPQKIRFKKITL